MGQHHNRIGGRNPPVSPAPELERQQDSPSSGEVLRDQTQLPRLQLGCASQHSIRLTHTSDLEIAGHSEHLRRSKSVNLTPSPEEKAAWTVGGERGCRVCAPGVLGEVFAHSQL